MVWQVHGSLMGVALIWVLNFEPSFLGLLSSKESSNFLGSDSDFRVKMATVLDTPQAFHFLFTFNLLIPYYSLLDMVGF